MSRTIREWEEYCERVRKNHFFETNWDNAVEKLFLIISEVIEAGEELRMEDRDIKKFKLEIADIYIRLFDFSGSLNLGIEYAIEEKMKINETRPAKHGKRF